MMCSTLLYLFASLVPSTLRLAPHRAFPQGAGVGIMSFVTVTTVADGVCHPLVQVVVAAVALSRMALFQIAPATDGFRRTCSI